MNQQSHLVALTSAILTYIVEKAETTQVTVFSHPTMGTRITIGEETFHGPDDSAIEAMLKWVLEREPTLKREDYIKLNEELPDPETESVEDTAEEFAEGGMSEFGKEVERQRAERIEAIKTSLSLRSETQYGRPGNVYNLMSLQEKLAYLDDPTLQEIQEAIRQLEEEWLEKTPSDASGSLPGSTDKLN